MNLDTLRQSWQSMKIEVDGIKEQNRQLTQRIFNNQAKTVRDYVKRRYRMLVILGVAYSFIMPWLCVRELQMSVLPTVLMSLFFPFSVVINGSVLYMTSRIHPSKMTVKEMLIAFTNLKIHRSRCRIIGYTVAIPVLIALLIYMRFIDEAMFYAGCVGGVIGACIGIYQDVKMSREIRQMRRSLAEELEE
ncbi:MAG: hypothetical protein K2M07_06915 [Muribaculaceae bacterium]|nr:hypothetical protein [Muribaculaceae bacterium]